MKFAVNHPWKFENYRIAFLSGFLQGIMILVVESVNYIALITNLSHLDIVMNFLALVVIADFDDFFYNALFDTEYKDIVTNGDGVYDEFLKVVCTTSREARFDVTGNRT